MPNSAKSAVNHHRGEILKYFKHNNQPILAALHQNRFLLDGLYSDICHMSSDKVEAEKTFKHMTTICSVTIALLKIMARILFVQSHGSYTR